MPTASEFRAPVPGTSWNGSAVGGKPVFVTYSFPTTLPDHQRDEFGKAGFQPLTAAQQAEARRALDAWDSVSGIHFLEVDPGKGDINFGVYDFSRLEDLDGISSFSFYPDLTEDTGAATLAGIPTLSWDLGGDIFLNRDGGTSFGVMLHEIGHAIGLKAPFDGDPGFPRSLFPHLPGADHAAVSDGRLTGMLTRLDALDIAAVQRLYGKAETDGTQVSRWSFDARTDTLIQYGRSGDDAILGISTSDRMIGGSGHDSLAGLAGSDTLSGGGGNDFLFGGTGDDLLLPGSGMNLIDGGDGFDTLSYAGERRAMTVTLDIGDGTGVTRAGGVETDHFGSIEAIIGGSGNDILTGDAGSNTLQGGAGADRLDGGRGVDTASYAEATGRVRASLADPGTNAGDARGDRYVSIERLEGSAFSDGLTGNAGRNLLSGGGGNDVLAGGGGIDTLTGGTGSDRFVFSTAPGPVNVDLVTDFDPRFDSLVLDDAVFGALAGRGVLDRHAFRDLATGAADRSDRILYDSATGSLFYDADGSGSGHGAIRFAVLTGRPGLSAGDVLVV